jgi:TPR repeat protein
LLPLLRRFCCLTQAGSGAAPEAIRQRAESVSKGGAAAFDRLTHVADPGDAVTQYEISRNNAEAVRWIRKAADEGDARAQAKLGSIYKDGKGTARDDAVAAKWYHKAADQGLAQAQYDLGLGR